MSNSERLQQKLSEFRQRKRRERALARRSAFCDLVKACCGYALREPDFIDVDQSDELRRLFDRPTNAESGPLVSSFEWDVASISEILVLVGNRIQSWSSDLVFLVPQYSEEFDECFVLPSQIAIKYFREFWKLIGNDVGYISSMDRSNRIRVELNFYTFSGEYRRDGVFQLTSWTDENTHL